MKKHTEKAFEESIEQAFMDSGYISGDPENFDRERAIDQTELVPFIKATQPETWQALTEIHKDQTETILIDYLVKALDREGCLNVLRHGFKCFGKLVQVAYFAPASSMNPDTQARYEANRLTVVRQLKYSPDSENSIDIGLLVNGLPIVTMELKNHMTGQNVNHAKHQYRVDRDPKKDPKATLLKFKKRALVHFAVDTEEVWMCTKLAGKSTFFLPFNKGRDGGAGNPDNGGNYRTAYLWEEVLERHSLMDILTRFLHLEVKESKTNGKKFTKETMIFPRYHQLNVVRKLIAHSEKTGPGTNYLVQHSAGSGKSNSIAWLAHRLASLHNDQDKRVFDSVVVITDRRVLDFQLQNTIYQFEHKQGVVEKINENSTQLANALKAKTPIIITTLQKFPFVTEKIGELPKQNYAVIVDEAHSSQSGESATELKGVLSGAAIREKMNEDGEASDTDDIEDTIRETMLKRGKQPNLSFYAFTATPKYKTLEVFGQPGPDGKPAPFHLYSMRQAIEERFIMDVLANYTTYKAYYGLIKSIEDDPEVDKKKAATALARFMSLHPHNIAQKTEVIIEHFRAFTRHKIGGKAKAMVVTRSRLHAVKYKESFDKYIMEKGYTDIKTLVAFSGTVTDEAGQEFTEVGMNNGVKEKELPKKFNTEEYQVLLVAEKYQTGFDQPLLHTMYVDKKLAGVQAVQTLSRLNRIHSGKEDTFVLDFVNTTEEVYEAFKPYYETPLVGDQVEVSQLYDLQYKLDEVQIYHKEEKEKFCEVFFRSKRRHTQRDHALMDSFLNPAVDRFKQLDEDEQDVFRKTAIAYKNLYSFMAQIIPFTDSDLEKLFTFVRFLLTKLPRKKSGPQYHFDDEVSLKYYRLQKISEGAIKLNEGESGPLAAPTEVGTGKAHEEKVELSSLVDQINERFGTEWTGADQLFFDQLEEAAVEDVELQQFAKANTEENFQYPFEKALEGLFIDRMDQNDGIFAKFMNDDGFKKLVNEYLRKKVYKRIIEEEVAGM